MHRPFTFSNMGITHSLGLGIGVLLLLIVSAAATGYLSTRIEHSARESIETSTQIQQLVLEMDRGMEKARRLHGDFFLQYPTVGLAKAHEQYAQPSVRQIAQVITASDTLKRIIDGSDVSAALRRSRAELNLYLSSARRFADTSIRSVELVTELAAPEKGLEAKLDGIFEALQQEVASIDTLAPLNGEMTAFALKYRIARKRHLMQSAFNSAFWLREKVDNDATFARDRAKRIGALLDRFTETAEKIMAIDVAIKGKFNDFALQAESVAPVAKTLIDLSKKEVEQVQAKISRAHRYAMVMMAAMTLTGLLMAAAIARMLNNSITRRVVRLTDAAGELRKGNLETFANEDGADELSELARTFNIMSARIRELVEDLERKVEQRTAELAESERRFRQLFEHSSSGVAVYEAVDNGQDFIFKDANKAVETIEGVRRQDIIGKKLTEVFPGVVEFGLFHVLRRVWQTGQPASHPVSFYTDQRLEGWRENKVYKLPSGEIVTVYDDLTVQMRAELEKKGMQAKLQQAQKMEAIGLLAGGVAHDFNNILGIILGNAELALDDTAEGDAVWLNLKEIRTASMRAKNVIRQLLSFSRKSEMKMKPVDIIPIVEESMQLLRASIPAGIDIQMDLPSAGATVLAEPTQIHQVILNLCTNAAHAMHDQEGVLRVGIADICLEGPVNPLIQGAAPGRYVELTVSDNGCGMPPDIQDRIFDPYFTTKEIGKGTGMGLSVVHGIVENHGGSILVDSQPDHGSTFRILLPLVAGKSGRGRVGSGTLPQGSEKILLVDDEAALLGLQQTGLQRLGYTVEGKSDPKDAYAFFSANAEHFDLVITDMAMPGMSGDELTRKILGIRPDMPIILCTGYSDNMSGKEAAAMGIRKYLEKPYKLEDLALAIREVLD